MAYLLMTFDEYKVVVLINALINTELHFIKCYVGIIHFNARKYLRDSFVFYICLLCTRRILGTDLMYISFDFPAFRR